MKLQKLTVEFMLSYLIGSRCPGEIFNVTGNEPCSHIQKRDPSGIMSCPHTDVDCADCWFNYLDKDFTEAMKVIG